MADGTAASTVPAERANLQEIASTTAASTHCRAAHNLAKRSVMLGNLFRPWCEQRDQLLVGGDQPPASDSSTSSSSSSNSSSSSSSSSPSRITENDNDGDMTGEDDAASGFSSPSSSMVAMMPDEEDEEEPIFEEDTAIGTSAGSCVDPPAEEGKWSPFEPGELTVSERAALEAQLLPYLVSSRFSDLRRLLEEAGWPAACYNGLEHVQVAGSLKESSDQQRPGTEEAAAGNEEEQEQSEADRDDDAGPEAAEGGEEEASPQGEQPPPRPRPARYHYSDIFLVPCPDCAVTRRICRDDYACTDATLSSSPMQAFAADNSCTWSQPLRTAVLERSATGAKVTQTAEAREVSVEAESTEEERTGGAGVGAAAEAA
eukprot:g76048.t1